MKMFRFWLSLLPAFFPLYLVRFDLFNVPTTLFEIVVVATVGWGVALVRPESVQRFFKHLSWPSHLLPAGLFLVTATVSMMMVPAMTLDINGDLVESARMAQGIWKGWMVMPLLYFFMIFVIEKEINWWSRVFMALAVSGLGLSFWAIFQMVTGDFSTWDGRASGPFESANYLS